MARKKLVACASAVALALSLAVPAVGHAGTFTVDLSPIAKAEINTFEDAVAPECENTLLELPDNELLRLSVEVCG